MNDCVRIAVRELVEFLLRSGSLREGRGGWADRDAMLAGARIHRKIQKSRGPLYRAEVPLSWEEEITGGRLRIEGRADGIYEDDGTVVEEIKGIYADPEELPEAVPVHLAQARCYAYLIAKEKDLDAVCVRITYVQLETEETRSFYETMSFAELEAFFRSLVEAYIPWAEFRLSWNEKRTETLKQLVFPFPYRAGQQDLVHGIYRTILREKQVFVQAPTGVGKTVATLFPACKAVGEGLAERIFYLTARNTTRTVAEETLRTLRAQSIAIKSLSITAKEKICPQREEDGSCPCVPERCPLAHGHYDRINAVLFSVLTSVDVWDRESLLRAAEERQVCPYALQSDLTVFADILIADYNYAFDPSARLRVFFGETARDNRAVFLIDEAHNLIDRGCEMFSADLYREELLQARRRLATDDPSRGKPLMNALQRCARILLQYRKEEEGLRVFTTLEDFRAALPVLLMRFEEWVATAEEPLRSELLPLLFRLQSMEAALERYRERDVLYGKGIGKRDYYLKMFCTDPSVHLQEVLDSGRAAVFFSATLVPIAYYTAMLSGREDDYTVAVPSPFPAENRTILIGTDVTTRYTRRTASEYRKIATYIARSIALREGNYMAFFPSYQVLEAVVEAFRSLPDTESIPKLRLLIQERDMTEEARETFLQAFTEETQGTLLGCCVMGGIFAEGIDLQGERLIGAILVGTGLPQQGEERELLRKAYRENGFAYAYRNPGMNKVLQAAGRVIRTETDKGWILLLDERFTGEDYRPCFPPAWADRRLCDLETVEEEIRSFWDRSIGEKI